jgi:hypothetical protein
VTTSHTANTLANSFLYTLCSKVDLQSSRQGRLHRGAERLGAAGPVRWNAKKGIRRCGTRRSSVRAPVEQELSGSRTAFFGDQRSSCPLCIYLWAVALWFGVHRSAGALRIPRRRWAVPSGVHRAVPSGVRRAVPSSRYRVGRCPTRCPNTSWDVGARLRPSARPVCGCVPVREQRVRHAFLPRSPSGSSDPRKRTLLLLISRAKSGGRPSHACVILPVWRSTRAANTDEGRLLPFCVVGT